MENFTEHSHLLKDLPPSAIYLAGYLEGKTSLKQEVILKFLRKVYLTYIIPESQLANIEKKLFDCRIAEVSQLLEESYSFKTSNPDILISSLKSCNIYKQKVNKSSLKTCFVCGKRKIPEESFAFTECKHSFHQVCIVSQLEYLLGNNVWQLRCFVCADLISLNDLVVMLPPLLLESYDKIRARSSLNRGFKVQCTNPICKEIIWVENENWNCVHCKTRVRLD